MGDLVRRDDREGLRRADKNVDAAVIAGTAAVHEYAHTVYRESVVRMTKEAKQIEDPDARDLTVPHLVATADQLGKNTLEAADEASRAMRQRAAEWKRNRR